MREVPFVQPSKVLPVYFEQKESAPLEPQTYSEFHIRLYCKKRCAKNEARYELFYIFPLYFYSRLIQPRLQKILLWCQAEFHGSPRNGLVHMIKSSVLI